jgi:non-specific serine/threonine protein kinase
VAGGVVDGKVILVGGFGATGPTQAVDIYDLATRRWTQGPPLPVPVNHAMVATVGDTFYVVGGYIGVTLGGAARPASVPTDRVFAYRAGLWSELPPMPAPRAAGAATRVGRDIFVVGGASTAGLAEDTYAYDVDEGGWTTHPGLPTPREHLGAATSKGAVYAIGGRVAGVATNLASVDRFDPDSGKWTSATPLPRPRGGLAAVGIHSGRIIAVGGEAQDRAFGDVDVLDTRRMTWTSLPDMPTARHGLAVAFDRGILHTFAGGPEPNLSHSSAHESLDIDCS